MIALILAASLSTATVEIVDSKDDSSKTYIIINSCKILIDKSALKDEDRIIAEALRLCENAY